MWRRRKTGEALEKREMGNWQEVRLLVEEDSTEEVEVVADVEQSIVSQEPEEKLGGEPERTRPGTPGVISSPMLRVWESLSPSDSEFSSECERPQGLHLYQVEQPSEEGHLAQRCAIFQGTQAPVPSPILTAIPRSQLFRRRRTRSRKRGGDKAQASVRGGRAGTGCWGCGGPKIQQNSGMRLKCL